MNLVKVISSSIDDMQRRIVKFLRFGKSDVQTSVEVSAYGIDSNPIKDMVAVYAETGEKGKTVIVGYINKNQMAAVGETRLFSTNSLGVQQTYVWLKANGDIEVGGNTDNIVKYTPLNTAMTTLAATLNAQLVAIAAGIAAGGGSYSPATITIDISSAKVDKVKTE